MGKLYFSVNKDLNGGLCDKIFMSKSKTTAKNELRDQGLTPKLVLCWEDVQQIQEGTFLHKDVTPQLEEFVLSCVTKWENQRSSHPEACTCCK